MRCSTSSTLSSLWLSTCSEVGIFIDVPQGVRAKQLEVSIQAGHLRVGIQGLPPYLDVSSRCSLVSNWLLFFFAD
jgi:hypothetical protein